MNKKIILVILGTVFVISILLINTNENYSKYDDSLISTSISSEGDLLLLYIQSSEKIPEIDNLPISNSAVGFGYLWMSSDNQGIFEKNGILVNVHKANFDDSVDSWHNEFVGININENDEQEFCLFPESVIGEVNLEFDKVRAVISSKDTGIYEDDLKKILVVEIVEDYNCESDLGIKILEEKEI